ncbi:hypothetical protein ES692_01245 [Psychroserpens burtonensis]|uniref:Uncharacterized protein n=1 Tax=Psychroserpens burtonensis TaxID=49278 RepID=A0A5C7BCB8_9FLAO|nr:hypothetical protein [Psychroserpens burtonensis]TXE19913.1 hypothetical protein ES692_01245 [Psychroserpens burtonensis]
MPTQRLIKAHGFEKVWAVFESKRDRIGLINQDKIKQLYKKYSYLEYKEVGTRRSSNFYISIQHTDNDVAFQ